MNYDINNNMIWEQGKRNRSVRSQFYLQEAWIRSHWIQMTRPVCYFARGNPKHQDGRSSMRNGEQCFLRCLERSDPLRNKCQFRISKLNRYARVPLHSRKQSNNALCCSLKLPVNSCIVKLEYFSEAQHFSHKLLTFSIKIINGVFPLIFIFNALESILATLINKVLVKVAPLTAEWSNEVGWE